MYILSLDFGSTNYKCLLLSIDESKNETNIKILGKGRSIATDFAIFIYDIFKRYDIKENQVEAIIATGTGSSFLEDKFNDIKVIKIDEFDAIAYGGLILSKLEEANIVSIGTGTAIVYSDMDKVERIGGTGLGGGSFVGLGSAILSDKNTDEKSVTNFKTLLDMAKNGDKTNVDLMIGDINKGSIGKLTSDITAANFAALQKKSNTNDYIASLLNMILENISLLVNAVKKTKQIVYIGTLVSDDYVKSCLKKIAEYTGDEIMFVDESEYAIAIGAWEYYLLNIRKNY